MNITVKHIQQIEAVLRLKSFARAAEELHLSQPALSRSISTLEDRLGVKLFDRGKGGISPTSFGNHIFERGKGILHDINLLERDLNLMRGAEVGQLAIGCGPFPSLTIMGQSVARFHKQHSRLDIKSSSILPPG